MRNDSKPDHEFDAYLKRQGSPDVLCDVRVWLPRDASEDMYILMFAPGSQDVDSVFSQGSLTLTSETYQEVSTFEVVASGVHLKGVSAPAVPRKASGITFDLLHIAELTIDSKISAGSKSTGAKSDEIVKSLCFQLSDLKYAKPEAFVTPDYLGDRKVDIKKTYVVKCSNNYGYSGEFRLEKHYPSWREHGINKEIVCSQRVLAWQGIDSTKVADIPHLFRLADDVCLLLSLAARRRVMVLGYHYFTQYRSFQQFRSPLERNRIEREETGRDELIPLAEFEAFMQTAITSWGNLSKEGQDSIRLAIVVLHPLTEPSPERDYLAMFAALEGLSKLHKDKVVSELDQLWKDVEAALSKCIDSQSAISSDAQVFLKKNLSALKQGKKLEDRIKEFFKSRNITVDDLWPVFGEDKLPDLYWARNELAHGRHFSDERFGAFLKAQEHLSLVLERVVLCMLGFDPLRTTAGMQSLFNQGRRLSNAQLKEFQTQLSKMPST